MEKKINKVESIEQVEAADSGIDFKVCIFNKQLFISKTQLISFFDSTAQCFWPHSKPSVNHPTGDASS